MHHGLRFDTTLQFALQMQTVTVTRSTVTKTTKDHKDLFWKPLVKPVMLKQERTASNRQLQYERQTDTCNPYLRGTTCLWVLPVLNYLIYYYYYLIKLNNIIIIII